MLKLSLIFLFWIYGLKKIRWKATYVFIPYHLYIIIDYLIIVKGSMAEWIEECYNECGSISEGEQGEQSLLLWVDRPAAQTETTVGPWTAQGSNWDSGVSLQQTDNPTVSRAWSVNRQELEGKRGGKLEEKELTQDLNWQVLLVASVQSEAGRE